MTFFLSFLGKTPSNRQSKNSGHIDMAAHNRRSANRSRSLMIDRVERFESRD